MVKKTCGPKKHEAPKVDRTPSHGDGGNRVKTGRQLAYLQIFDRLKIVTCRCRVGSLINIKTTGAACQVC